jgi:hypothetical protein
MYLPFQSLRLRTEVGSKSGFQPLLISGRRIGGPTRSQPNGTPLHLEDREAIRIDLLLNFVEYAAICT